MKKISMLSLMLMGAFAVSNANATQWPTITVDYDSTQGHKTVAKISQAVKAQHDSDLNFGTSTIVNGVSGTVYVAPGKTGSQALTLDNAMNRGTDVTGGTIKLWGPSGTRIYVDEGTVSNGENTMTVTPVVQIGASGTAGESALVRDSDTDAQSEGGLTILTGGTLSIGANQPAGDYSGYLPISIVYPGDYPR